ncbi:MAG: FAD-binding oxidoreductase [Proteobacteria bacterium]|nr:FAD-binding oxidoreductase [Pseudomonadota bacterium]
MSFEAIVVGGGMMGAAIGFGLAREGLRTALLDEGDRAFRAARGNFGRIVVSGKGVGFPDYTRWSRLSTDAWPGLAAELRDLTGIDTGFRREGGIYLCFGEAELEERARTLALCREEAGDLGFDFEVLDHARLAALLPGIGPTMPGGTYCPQDGEVNPLLFLRALHAGLRALGGATLSGARASALRADGGGFALTAGGETVRADRVVVAAGHGTSALARQLGLDIPTRPERGQLLVTERTAPFLPLPTDRIRQTREGTVMIGRVAEDAGFDDGTTTARMAGLARDAVRAFPALARLRVVRAWGCLRVLTPDGLPVYTESARHPGAYAATCHSAVTLGAAHARLIARWIATGARPPAIARMHEGRFAPAKAA